MYVILFAFTLTIITIPLSSIPSISEETERFERPGYKIMRYDDDFSFLRNPKHRTDFFDPIKYIPLFGDSYISLGSEIRERYEYTKNPVWGQAPVEDENVFLQRYMVFADFHYNKYLRAFAQLKSVLVSGREPGPSPVDKNELTFQQAFVDLNMPINENSVLTVRPGRQEVNLGSGRLVSVREGPNLRRSFDGFRTIFKNPNIVSSGLAMRPTEDNSGVFDDGINEMLALWGIYNTVFKIPFLPGPLDIYYLGYRNDNSVYEQGAGEETRHTVGARFFGRAGGFDYNWEFIYQFGKFNSGNINAWSVASITGYTFPEVSLKPRVELNSNIASGDKNPDTKSLQTFNPLFPRGSYFSQLALLGPRNFFNLKPGLSALPREDVFVGMDANFFWRYSVNDGVYSPSGQLLRASDGSDARYVGSAISGEISWQVNTYLRLTAVYTHVFPGEFIKQTGPSEEIDFIELTVKFVF